MLRLRLQMNILVWKQIVSQTVETTETPCQLDEQVQNVFDCAMVKLREDGCIFPLDLVDMITVKSQGNVNRHLNKAQNINHFVLIVAIANCSMSLKGLVTLR